MSRKKHPDQLMPIDFADTLHPHNFFQNQIHFKTEFDLENPERFRII